MADPSQQSFKNRLAMFQQQNVQQKDSFQDFRKKSTQTQAPSLQQANSTQLGNSLPNQLTKPPQTKPIDISKLSQKWQLNNPLETQNQETQLTMSKEQPQRTLLQSKINIVESDEEEEIVEVNKKEQKAQSYQADLQNLQSKPQLERKQNSNSESDENSNNIKNNPLNLQNAQVKDQQQNIRQKSPSNIQLQQSYQLYLKQKQQNENQLRQEQFQQYQYSQMNQSSNTLHPQSNDINQQLNTQQSCQDKVIQIQPKMVNQEKSQEIHQQQEQPQQSQEVEVQFKSTLIESDGEEENLQSKPQVDQLEIHQQQEQPQQSQQVEVQFKSTLIESDGEEENLQSKPQVDQLEIHQQQEQSQQSQQDEIKFKSTLIESDGEEENLQSKPQVDQLEIHQQQEQPQQSQQVEVQFKSTLIESDGEEENLQSKPQVDQLEIHQQQEQSQQSQQVEVQFKSTLIESDGEEENLQSKQQEQPQQSQQVEVQFKSTLIESEGEEENLQSKPQVDQLEIHQQQEQPQQSQQVEVQFKSTLIESDGEEENFQVQEQITDKDTTQQQGSMLQTTINRISVQQQSDFYKQQQIILNSKSEGLKKSIVASKAVESDDENEIKKCETDEETEPHCYNVTVSKVKSEEENDDEQEELDEIDEMINSTEVNQNNKLLMSCFSRNLQKSLSSQQQNNEFLHQSFRQGELNIRSSKIVFMKDSLKPIVVSDDEYFSQNLEKVLMVQNRWRAKIQLRKLKKRDRYRKNVLKELISTEESYVKDLKIIINELLKPLSKVANELEMKKIFNVESIYGLNSCLLQELLVYRKTLDEDRYQKTMGVMKDYLAYFKLYYEYCKNYTQATKLFEQYEQNNKQFCQELQRIYKSNVLRGMDVHSFLVKPVQRLPKYILLLKDLLKHTNEEHPDYQNISKCLNDFCKINDDNNDEMSKYLNQLKLVELQNMFGNHLVIAEPTRQFLFEDTSQYYKKNQIKQIILYGFNNLLLMTCKNDYGVEKYEHHLDLTADSFIKDLEDTQFLFNLVEVITFNDSITFICNSKESKNQFYCQIEKLIQELVTIKNQKEVAKQKNKNSFSNYIQENFKPKYHIIVKVTGTESRNVQTNQYTMYIILVTIEGIEQKTFVRYSQIADLQSVVKKHDPQLKIPHFSSLKWLSNQDPKVIEERKLMIEKFLQLVLNSENILNNEDYKNTILSALQIDKNFYLLPEKTQGVSRNSFSNQSLIENVLASQFRSNIRPNQLQSIIMQRQATKILSLAQENKTTRTIMDFLDTNDVKVDETAKNCPYFVEIGISDGSWIKVGFKQETRVYSIKSALATHLKLDQWIDYSLFLSDSDNQIRKIDDQECLAVILDGNQIKDKKGLGFLKKQFNKIFSQQYQVKILFRKYFYLSPTQEEKDYLQDSARLRLFTYEIIQEVFQEKYILSFNEYCVHTALYIMLLHYEKKGESEEPILEFDPDILNKAIPQKILKTNKIKLWVEQIILFIKDLQQKIIKKKQDNIQRQKKDQRMLQTKLSRLIQQMIIDNVKSNMMFGMSAFYVECPKEVAKNIQKNLGVKVPPNIYLGCNYCAFYFLRPDNKNKIFSFGYENITNLKAFPSDFQVTICNVMYQFKTPIAFEIKQQIQAYQEIITFTNELKRNS